MRDISVIAQLPSPFRCNISVPLGAGQYLSARFGSSTVLDSSHVASHADLEIKIEGADAGGV